MKSFVLGVVPQVTVETVVVRTPMLRCPYFGGLRKAELAKLLHEDCTNKSEPISWCWWKGYYG